MKTITRPRKKTSTSKQSATKFAEVFGTAPEQQMNAESVGTHRHMADTRTADRAGNAAGKADFVRKGNDR